MKTDADVAKQILEMTDEELDDLHEANRAMAQWRDRPHNPDDIRLARDVLQITMDILHRGSEAEWVWLRAIAADYVNGGPEEGSKQERRAQVVEVVGAYAEAWRFRHIEEREQDEEFERLRNRLGSIETPFYRLTPDQILWAYEGLVDAAHHRDISNPPSAFGPYPKDTIKIVARLSLAAKAFGDELLPSDQKIREGRAKADPYGRVADLYAKAFRAARPREEDKQSS